jgi:hypothetical protein
LDEYDDPLWIRVLAFVLAAAVAAYGAVGLFLAIVGWYRLGLALVVGSGVFAGLCVLARPLLPTRGAVTRTAHVSAVLAVVAIVFITVWNVSNASQQVLIIRDGGTYLNAGKWISGHGTLEVDPFVGPFTTTSGLAASSAGMTRRADHLDFNLEHMFPALLAEAQGVGGDRLMFAMNALLGGVALLAFYLLARRVLRYPVAALGAVLCLGVLMPQVAFSRDSTTEISMQILVFSAAWMLCDPRTLRHRSTAFVAGLFLGLLQAIHIDGLAFIVGVPFVGLLCWVGTEKSARRRVAFASLFLALGAVLGVALGWLDLLHSSPHYLHSLRRDIGQLRVATILAIVAAVALAWFAQTSNTTLAKLRSRLWSVRAPAGVVAAVVVLLAGFAAWIVRPRIQTTRGRANNAVVAFLQLATHQAFDPKRRYFEHALQWAGWYVGAITLTIAIIGAAYATRAFFRGNLRVPSEVVALVLGPPAVLYLYRPSITPDQIWATRRFVPAALPILVLAAFGLLCVLARQDRFGFTPARRVVAVVLGVVAIAYPLHVLTGVSRMTQQRGFHTTVLAVCKTVGKDGAIVVPQEAALTWLYDPQTLRSFCNVPVAIMLSGEKSHFAPRLPDGRLDADVLRQLAQAWAKENRHLYLVAAVPHTINQLFPGLPLRADRVGRNPHLLEQTLVTRPDAYKLEKLAFAIARVPAVPAR